jgi:hypothetical protein
MMRQAAAEDPEVQAWLERIYISNQRRKSKDDRPTEGVDTGDHAASVDEAPGS